MRMRMTQHVHRDPGAEIEILPPIFVEQIRTFAAHERHIRTRVCRQQRWEAHEIKLLERRSLGGAAKSLCGAAPEGSRSARLVSSSNSHAQPPFRSRSLRIN